MSIDPFTAMAISTALTAAGSASDSAASAGRTGAINSGRNGLMQAEINRQNGLSAEAWPIFQQTADKRGAVSSNARREGFVNQRIADTAGPIVSPIKVGGAPAQVNNEIGRVAHNIGEVVARNAAGKARLEGYGDVAAEDAVDQSRASNKLNTISNFARGSSAVLPAEFESSDHNAAMSNQNPLGAILKLLGTGAGLYGAYSPLGKTGSMGGMFPAAGGSWNAGPI